MIRFGVVLFWGECVLAPLRDCLSRVRSVCLDIRPERVAYIAQFYVLYRFDEYSFGGVYTFPMFVSDRDVFVW